MADKPKQRDKERGLSPLSEMRTVKASSCLSASHTSTLGKVHATVNNIESIRRLWRMFFIVFSLSVTAVHQSLPALNRSTFKPLKK